MRLHQRAEESSRTVAPAITSPLSAVGAASGLRATLQRSPLQGPEVPVSAAAMWGSAALGPASAVDRMTAHLQMRAKDPMAAIGMGAGGRVSPLPGETTPDKNDPNTSAEHDDVRHESPVSAEAESASPRAPLPSGDSRPSVVQMACGASCGCTKCSAAKGEDEDRLLGTLRLQREARPGASSVGTASPSGGRAGPPSVDAGEVRSRLGAGASLPVPVVQKFSSAYGHDLSSVRIHSANSMADQLGARAFTVGRDVAFAPGEYRPGTSEGDRLIGHELAHVVQQSGGEGTVQGAGLSEDAYEREADHAADRALSGHRVPQLSAVGAVVQRDPKKDAAAPPPGGPAPAAADKDAVVAPPLDDDWLEKLIAREDKAIAALNGRRDQIACSYLPVSPSSLKLEEGGIANYPQKRQQALVHVKLGEVVPRSLADGERRGFDTPAAATAFAAGAGTGAGAVVVSHDTLYFAMRLQPSGGPGLNREHVFELVPGGGVLATIGEDGFLFAAGKSYEPDVDKLAAASVGGKKTDPKDSAALPPPVQDLAKLAGIRRPGDQTPALPEGVADPNVVEIKPEMVEGFLRQYFVARGLETLDANEAAALEEMATFKGGETTTASMPPKAQAQIDQARQVGVSYKKLLDAEIELEEVMSELGRERSWSASSEAIVELRPGHRLKIKTWKRRIEKSQELVTAAKAELLSKNPLLAQMIDLRAPRSQFTIDLRYAAGKIAEHDSGLSLGLAIWDKITGPKNPVVGNELSYGGSQEGDKQVREGYLLKLDAVLKAIGQVKAKVLGGDLRELAGMPGLSHRVMADLSTIAGKNAGLGDAARKKLQELGASAGEIAATAVTVAGVVLQLAGFFFPPLEFIGAVLSFGASAYRMNRSLEAWQTSQAALTPDQALVDPVAAQQALVDETIALALEAINTGVSLNGAFKAIEMGRAPKSFLKEVEAGSAGRGVDQAVKAIGEERAAAEAAGARAGDAGLPVEHGGAPKEAHGAPEAPVKEPPAGIGTRAEREASVHASGRVDSPDLTPKQMETEIQHIRDNPHLIQGKPPNREVAIGEHHWYENASGGWCRHSTPTPKACVLPGVIESDKPISRWVEMANGGVREFGPNDLPVETRLGDVVITPDGRGRLIGVGDDQRLLEHLPVDYHGTAMRPRMPDGSTTLYDEVRAGQMGTAEGNWARYQHYLEERSNAARGAPLTFEEWNIMSEGPLKGPLRAPGQGVPKESSHFKWGNPESEAYGHTVSTHGHGVHNETEWFDRARKKGSPQGVWSDNSLIIEAEQRAPLTPGEHVVNMGRPVGTVYLPDGTKLEGVSIVKVIRSHDGTVKTAYPFV